MAKSFTEYEQSQTIELETPFDTTDTITFNIVNRTIVPVNYLHPIVKEDANSRKIHFRMQRFFDGVDLSNKTITVTYVGPTGEKHPPVLILDKMVVGEGINFYWLVGESVCRYDGIVNFKITVSDNDGYVWNTLPSTIFVGDGINGNDPLPPTEDWYQSWLIQADGYLNQIQQAIKATVLLRSNNWESGTQTVSLLGVTPEKVVLVCPEPSSEINYLTYGVNCVSQDANSLTFSCTTTPLVDVSANVVIF